MADGDSTQLKQCYSCRCFKSKSEFHVHRQKRDGLNSWCKPCARQKQTERLEKTPEWKAHKRAYDAARYLQRAEQIKKRVTEHYKMTREKRIAYVASWVKANPEKRRASSGNYKHKRRAVESGGASTSEVVRWKAAQPQVCFWCKTTGCKLVLDHYFPLSRGGAHETSNFVLACRSCNARKSAKPPEQFAAENGIALQRLFP